MATDTDFVATMQRQLAEARAGKPSETWAAPSGVLGHDGLVRPGTAVDTSACPFNECQIRRMCTRPGAVGCQRVSDELLALAEAATAAQPGEQTPDEQRAWASRLAADVVTADRSGAHILALAAQHDVITADELPQVLASIEEARNGPASGPWCENCGDALDGAERSCPQPVPGEPLKQCGRGGHMFRLDRPPVVVLTPGSTWTGPDGTVYDVVRPKEVGNREKWWVGYLAVESGAGLLPDEKTDLHHEDAFGRMAAALVVHRDVKPENVAQGGQEVRLEVLENLARIATTWRATPPVDAHGSTAGWVRALTDLERAIDGLPSEPTRDVVPAWIAALPALSPDGSPPPLPLTEIDAAEWRRLAGERAADVARLEGEVERLENGRAGWVSLHDQVGEAIKRHLPEVSNSDGVTTWTVERIANAGAVLDATARDRDEWRRRHTLAEAGATSLETSLEINRTDPDEPLDQRLRRVFMHVVHQRCCRAKAERSRDRWKAKAKRLSEGARRGVVGGGTEGRRAARKGDAAGAGRRTGKQRAARPRKGKR
jgi:hypothetical protein